jgi:hypothetical protein
MLISRQFISPAINHFMGFSCFVPSTPLSTPYTSGTKKHFYIEMNLYNTFQKSIIIIVYDSNEAESEIL